MFVLYYPDANIIGRIIERIVSGVREPASHHELYDGCCVIERGTMGCSQSYWMVPSAASDES